MGEVTLYKVLDANGCSFHGGSLQWSLPKNGKPGEWHEVSGEARLCERGLHITDVPEAWWQDGARLFVVEPGAEIVGKVGDDTKVAVTRARLVREVTEGEYAASKGVRALRGRLSIGDGYGDGYGHGYGYGSGYGDGDGYGYGDGGGGGYGYGSGDGSGDGDGYGYGDGDGSGYGDGDGYGYGDGGGDGYGYGDGKDIVS